jgi:hypothetical protein
VAGSKTLQSQYRLYKRYAPPRLWRAVPFISILVLALSGGGCTLSSQLDSYLNGDRTGSITPPPGAKAAAALPPADDLAYARAAASEVLKRGEKDASLPWENPHSGARGTITPIATAYVQDGHTCRNFLASYVAGSLESWMQGEACRQEQGAWEVRSLKPWNRS